MRVSSLQEQINLLAVAATLIVAVAMSSGPWTYFDSIIGILVLAACLHLQPSTLHGKPIMLLFSGIVAGGVTLVISPIIEAVLITAGYANHLPEDRQFCVPNASFSNKFLQNALSRCREALGVLPWISLMVFTLPIILFRNRLG